MIWLIIGTLGIAIFFLALILVPVWVGHMTLKQSCILVAGSLTVTGLVALFSWALSHGINQVFL